MVLWQQCDPNEPRLAIIDLKKLNWWLIDASFVKMAHFGGKKKSGSCRAPYVRNSKFETLRQVGRIIIVSSALHCPKLMDNSN